MRVNYKQNLNKFIQTYEQKSSKKWKNKEKSHLKSIFLTLKTKFKVKVHIFFILSVLLSCYILACQISKPQVKPFKHQSKIPTKVKKIKKNNI